MSQNTEPKSSVKPEGTAKARRVLPGDKLSTIEEFTAGPGAAIVGDTVVSTVVGEARPDMINRVFKVTPSKQNRGHVPKPGDYVIGSVQSAQPSVAQVKIEGVNDEQSNKEFTGMLSTRDERRRRTSSPIKPGDIIRAKVSSVKNAIFHLTLDAPDCGALYTVCSVCGRDVVALGRDRVKCRECGWVDERLLADDFIRYSRTLVSS
ncbi:MAG TPA: exosome complex RNA-binding protein Csl4 [Nitrososphaerales archaeon]|nr:exosome complex RNA-binding protein Csl4 [Nitrososphaerales archaeon]